MGSSGVFSPSSSDPDTRPYTFALSVKDGKQFFCLPAEIVRQAGEPGWATFTIPLTTLPDHNCITGSTDAFKTSTGPALESRATVSAGYLTQGEATPKLLPWIVGTVKERVHSAGDDSVTIKVVDDLYLLTKLTMSGAYTINSNENLYYNTAQEPIFNPKGQPNCIDSSRGPVFAPFPRYGWTATTTTEPEAGVAYSQARSWTTADAVQYIVNCLTTYYTAAAAGNTDQIPIGIDTRYVTFTGIASSIVLPAGATDSNSSSETERTKRFLHNMSISGKTAYQALVMIGDRAGPFKLVAYPSTKHKSNISFVYQGAGRTKVDAKASADTYTFQSGSVTETSEMYHAFASVVGGAPLIERQVSTDGGTVTPSADPDSVSVTAAGISPSATDVRLGSLIPAWSLEDEQAYNRFIYLNSTKNTAASVGSMVRLSIEAAREQANKMWPLVYAAYKINSSYNFLYGTKYTTHTLPSTSPILHPTLLSGIQVRRDPGSTSAPGEFKPFQITIEALVAPGDDNSTSSIGATTNVWTVAATLDSLTLGPDGTYFMVPGLRDSVRHWTYRGSMKMTSETDYSNGFQANHIRATVAIKCPFRLYGEDSTDPNKVGGRVLGVIDGQYVSAPLEEYIEWLRVDSYPFGKRTMLFGAVGGTSTIDTSALGSPSATGKLVDKCISGGELYSDATRITKHAKALNRRYRKVHANGQLVSRSLELGAVIGIEVASINTLESGGTLTSIRASPMDQMFTYTFQ